MQQKNVTVDYITTILSYYEENSSALNYFDDIFKLINENICFKALIFLKFMNIK